MSIEDDLEPIDGDEPTRRITPGVVVSAVGHAMLLLWLLAGWGLSTDPLSFEVTEISVVSGEEYAAIVAATTPQPQDTLPEAPAAPETPTETPPPPEPEAPVTPQTPEPAPEAPVEEAPVPPAPEPLPPPPQDVPDAPPEIVTPAPPAPPPSAAIPQVAVRPQPRPAPRVAPEAAPPPPPEADVAPVVQQEVAPEAPAAEVVEEAQEATAPEEAATEIVTEAETPSGAVETAMRPPARPARPAPTQTPPETPPATPGSAATADSQNADAAAVAAAVAAAAASNPGPPMTGAERDAFRLSVQGCWVVDPGSTAARVTVTLAFELGRDGRVVNNQIVMIGNTGGEPAAVQTAFEAARRAVLRCQADGFPLPADKYEQWRLVEMTFNPADMRIR